MDDINDSTKSHTYQKYKTLEKAIHSLRVRDKRALFTLMENFDGLSHNTFFPEYGIEAGSFAVFYVLNDHMQRANRQKKNKEKEKK